ncbi:MAG: hypothetical protein UV05_C0005G0012 [candidate division CPR1 bacterium GW2011_GWA2_42_17]|uniref:Uncharacterized protein n=1 Tax=candidate division CPR1 bacterium GW2011_GWA2_42_17 TaxID=1618341 RepID=A0A0G0Z745_9BACT|nr:MAG: hypothetical protein UV05_C0005G0012 [candidate division CPR1 bacterium GW2011_GWA2_42_17]
MLSVNINEQAEERQARWSLPSPRPKIYRLWEILPAGLSWLTILAVIFLSFLAPIWAIRLVIIYDVYWLCKVAYFVFFVLLSSAKLKKTLRTPWWQKLLKEKNNQVNELWQIYLFPFAGGSIDVLRESISKIASQIYEHDKMVVVVACEERQREKMAEDVKKLKKEFDQRFFDFLIVWHPDHLPREIKGKGSNIYYVGQAIQKWLDERKIDYKKVLLSCLDEDSQLHPQYSALLAYKFLTVKNPLRKSYQPVVLYHNNMWNSPSIIRVSAYGTTFWLLSELSRADRLATFSSHSMPFQMLVEVGYWQKDIVSEDSRIFLQAFMQYDGDYRVEPLFLPLSMDTVMTTGWAQSLKGLYKQQRRWAWGVENFPWIMWQLKQRPQIKFVDRARLIMLQLEGMYSWATAPLVIFILGYIPLRVVWAYGATSVVVTNAPDLLQSLMQVAGAGMILSAIMSVIFLTKMPFARKKKGLGFWLVMVLQWIMLPLTLILFGSIPALEAQTRLALGKYMGFWVTEKKR